MNNKKWFVLVMTLLLTGVLLVACGGSTAKSNFPVGKFVQSNSKEDGLIFNEDGTFSAFTMGNVTLVSGTYTVKGDTYTETSNDGGCSTPMEFKYTYDGTNLTFNYVGDPAQDTCDGRRAGFNNVTYVLTK